ncbi:MAG TPA: hypothetical protein P5295_08805 [Spirochaetota bacterium]|nr:hypothetical protein [Spirochaetota bacterium]
MKLSSAQKSYYVEFVGMSGIGKSFLFDKFKEEQSNNPDFLFITKSQYRKKDLFNILILIRSFIKIIQCRLPNINLIKKYIKLWYFPQVLMHRQKQSEKKYIVIDEGPFHRSRSIKNLSKFDSDRVNHILFNKSIVSDIVVYVDALAEDLYDWRQKRGTISADMPLSKTKEARTKSFTQTSLDVQYVCKNIKDVKLINIMNKNNNINHFIESLTRQLYQIK